jgi:hypothetical protein
MKIKVIYIKSGNNNISLVSINEAGRYESIKNITFESVSQEYTFVFQRYCHYFSDQPVTFQHNKNDKTNIPTHPFILCRDGIVDLNLNSTIDGILTIYFEKVLYKTEIETIKDNFKENIRRKHYLQYYEMSGDIIRMDYDKLKKITYHKSDYKDIEVVKNIKESYKTFLIKNAPISKSFVLPRVGDYILEMEVSSSENNEISLCTQTSIDTELYRIPIRTGDNIYPLVLPIAAMNYTKICLYCDKPESIEFIKFIPGFLPPGELRGIILSKNILVENYGVKCRISYGIISKEE